uniref:Death associated protein 1b n=1 Tax=Neogobius melanostomus TaxID=47308 RepID=A0A8C6X075_9GOBI
MVQQVTRSTGKAPTELKAGHPPAVKAGGKRVAKKSIEDSGTPEKDAKKAEKQSRPATAPNKITQVNLLLSGTVDKLSHDFPETPVSVRHSRVLPALEKPHFPRAYFIQQPRKF